VGGTERGLMPFFVRAFKWPCNINVGAIALAVQFCLHDRNWKGQQARDESRYLHVSVREALVTHRHCSRNLRAIGDTFDGSCV
jgi:hypothetical protein